MLPDPFDAMTMDDLPNDGLVDVAQACGLKVVVALLRHFPGQHFFVPQNGFARVQAAAERAGREPGKYQVEDLPNPTWQIIARRCGMDVALSLLEHARNILVITPKNPFGKLCRRYVAEHSNGQNVPELALILNLTRSQIYNLLADRGPTRRPGHRRPFDPLQTTLV